MPYPYAISIGQQKVELSSVQMKKNCAEISGTRFKSHLFTY